MDLPDEVREVLADDEAVAAQVSLSGTDGLYVTPTRTLHYTGEGLLSDASVDAVPHDAERVEVSKGRGRAAIELDYGLDGERSLTVPADTVDQALHVVLAGVLRANGVTDPDESILRTYRFSELTLVLTADRIVKQVGEAAWDRSDYETIHFEDVTGMSVEEGRVASQIVLETTDRRERIKTPAGSLREVRERIEDALFSYHDVDSHAELEALTGEGEADVEEPTTGGDDDGTTAVDFGGLDAVDVQDDDASDEAAGDEASSGDATATDATTATDEETGAGAATDDAAADADADGASTGAGTADDPRTDSESEQARTDETGGDAWSWGDDDLEAQFAALQETIRRQRETLDEQEQRLEELAERLNRDR